MADQVVLLNAGRIEQDAPPAELYARPASVFAARFIGTPPMNIVAAPGRPGLQLGVRPEHVRLGRERRRRRPRGERRIPRRRHRRHLHDIGRRQLAETLAARLPGRHELAEGTPVRLGWSRGRQPFLRRRQRPALPRRRRRSPFPFPPEPLPGGDPHEKSPVHDRPRRRRARRSPCPPRRRRSPRSTSTIRSRSAARSPRRSTRWPPTSARRTRTSRSTRSIRAPTRRASSRRSPRTKSGKPPQLAVLLSTDMFSLIDEDAIVPIDDIAKSADDRKWLDGFYKSFMMNSRTGGKTWGIPFQRSTIVLYWNKEAFKEAGLDPGEGPGELGPDGRVREEADQDRRQRQRHPVGREDPVLGLPVLAVPGPDDAERRDPDERGGHRDLLRQAGGDRGAAVLGRPSAKHKVMPGGRDRVGHDAEGLLREEGGDDLDDDRQPHQHPHQRRLPVRRGDAAGEEASGQPDRRRQLLHLREDDAGRAGGGAEVREVGDRAAARRAVEHRHRLRRGHARGLGHAGDEEVRAGRAAGAGRARPARSTRSPSSRPTTTSASPRRSTTACRRRSPARRRRPTRCATRSARRPGC